MEQKQIPKPHFISELEINILALFYPASIYITNEIGFDRLTKLYANPKYCRCFRWCIYPFDC